MVRQWLGTFALKDLAMDDVPPAPDMPQRPTGRFFGLAAFQQMVRDALACAAHEGWHEIVVSDPTFADWPLGERAVCASLHTWARSGRQFTMLAASYNEVVRHHPRFVAWRTTWSHLIDCHACRSADPQDVPSALYSPVWTMRRLDLERSSGMCSNEAQPRVLLQQAQGEWLRKSSPAFPSSTLGL